MVSPHVSPRVHAVPRVFAHAVRRDGARSPPCGGRRPCAGWCARVRGSGGCSDAVGEVDPAPDSTGLSQGVLTRKVAEVVEVGGGPLEGGTLEQEEAFGIPGRDVVFLRVHVDGEVKEVRGDDWRSRHRLEHVQALEDENVWLLHHLLLAGDDVVSEVRVNRSAGEFSRLYGREEGNHAAEIVALRESLTVHKAALLQNLPWVFLSLPATATTPAAAKPPLAAAIRTLRAFSGER